MPPAHSPGLPRPPALAGGAGGPLELWGGVECTVNRVGDGFADQQARSGHAARLDDLDRFAALGLRTLRTPALWERVAPDGLDRADWRTVDARLGRMRALGLAPVVGFVHHGSGPPGTSLVDEGFVDGLARYARAFAERHPEVAAFTPVNEPLTTARFSGLYGHWYPHGRDAPTFARALVVQVRAVAAAMAAVREVTPGALLVQTEDLGRTWARPALAGQAAWENERRWLTWDLLAGRVGPEHPMRAALVGWGVPARWLDALADAPCPADVVGVNHYVTSERFLDERLERYPPHAWGGNGRQRYADVEAVRAVAGGVAGLEAALAEAWARYRRPVAVTEVHLGCTREEQVRWLAASWDAAHRARAAGADVRAVTVWALLGSFDWNSLLTRPAGHYEPGAFCVRGPEPRPTAVARLAADLAAGRPPAHPVLDGPGWWERPFRLAYPPVRAASPGAAPVPARPPRTVRAPRPLAILARGALGDAAERLCAVRGLAAVRLDPADLGPADLEAGGLARALADTRAWAAVDALDAARAAACARAGVRLLAVGSADALAPRAAPYAEADVPDDAALRAACPDALVVRTGAAFSPWEPAGAFQRALDALAAGLPACNPSVVNLAEAVHAALDLLVDGEAGVWHLAHPDAPDGADVLRAAAARMNLDPALVRDAPPAARLTSARGGLLAPLAAALDHFFDRDSGWTPRAALPTPAALS